jgi:hypothetical protein
MTGQASDRVTASPPPFTVSATGAGAATHPSGTLATPENLGSDITSVVTRRRERVRGAQRPFLSPAANHDAKTLSAALRRADGRYVTRDTDAAHSPASARDRGIDVSSGLGSDGHARLMRTGRGGTHDDDRSGPGRTRVRNSYGSQRLGRAVELGAMIVDHPGPAD